MTARSEVITSLARVSNSSPLVGSNSSFFFLTSAETSGSPTAFENASRRILTRSDGTPGVATTGRPNSPAASTRVAKRRVACGVLYSSKCRQRWEEFSACSIRSPKAIPRPKPPSRNNSSILGYYRSSAATASLTAFISSLHRWCGSGSEIRFSVRQSARPSKRYRCFDIRDYFRAKLLRYFEKNARLLVIARDRVPGKQYSFDGVIDPAGLLDRLMGGGLGGNMASQQVVGSRSDLDEHFHVVAS